MVTTVKVRWIAGTSEIAHAYEPRKRLPVCGYDHRPYRERRPTVVCLRCERAVAK